jgi:hypothetical protein
VSRQVGDKVGEVEPGAWKVEEDYLVVEVMAAGVA